MCSEPLGNTEVQDYLDLLLSQVTEKPEAQVEFQAEVPMTDRRRPRPGNRMEPLAAELAADEPNRFFAQPVVKPAATMLQPQRLLQSRKLVSLPYAEPPQPLAIKVPALKFASKVDTGRRRADEKPKVEVNSDQTRQAPVVEALIAKAPAKVVCEPVAPVAVEVAEPATDIAIAVDSSASVEAAKVSEWLANGRPSWAQQRFECLLFSVGGLALAVPLVELGAIHPMDDESLTSIFGQVNWFMGLMRGKNSNLRVIDTAQVVMPERYVETMREQYGYVISINGVDWALAVDSVANAIVLEPEDVRWRGERSKRPWLAGTVVEHMCALLDVSQLTAMFEAQGLRKKALAK
ncbi:MAG: chemotaxis protein CheW [Spongiibacteraceae bacterium]